MKRLNILILFMLTLPVWAQQHIAINWTDAFDFDRNQDFLHIQGINDGKLYALATSNSSPLISLEVDLLVFDLGSMKLQNTLTITDNRSDYNFENLVVTKDAILVFTSFYDRQLGFKILSVQEYNTLNNSLSDFYRVDEVFSNEKNVSTPFRISVSPDGEYILLYHQNPSVNGDFTMNLKVIDEGFDMLWEKELQFNYKERMFSLEELLIDNYGSVHMLTSLNPYGIKPNSGFSALINLKSALFTYRPHDDQLKEFEFALSKNWINSVKIELDIYQNLVATAFYTNPNDYKIRGFVVFELSGQTGTVTTRKMASLDNAFFKQIERSLADLKDYSKRLVGTPGIYPGTSSHMNHTSTEFNLDNILLSSTGNVLTIEVRRKDEICTETFNQQQMIVNCEKHFLYGDVILVFFNSSWEIEKLHRVRKIQHSRDNPNDSFSYSTLANDGGLFLFYNDDERNFDNNEAGDLRKIPLSSNSRARLQVEGFKYNGGRLDLRVMDSQPNLVGFYPSENQKLDNAEFLLYSRKEKNYKFGRLSIQ